MSLYVYRCVFYGVRNEGMSPPTCHARSSVRYKDTHVCKPDLLVNQDSQVPQDGARKCDLGCQGSEARRMVDEGLRSPNQAELQPRTSEFCVSQVHETHDAPKW